MQHFLETMAWRPCACLLCQQRGCRSRGNCCTAQYILLSAVTEAAPQKTVCGWGSKVLNFLVTNFIQCWYSIFRHSEHISFSLKYFKFFTLGVLNPAAGSAVFCEQLPLGREAKSSRYGRYICAILSKAVLSFEQWTDRNREHCAVRVVLLTLWS